MQSRQSILFATGIAAFLICGSAWAQKAQVPLYVGGVASETEEKSLRSLVNDSYAILRSDAFQANLSSLANVHKTIFLRMSGSGTAATAENGTVENLKALVGAQAPFRYVRTPIGLVGGTDYYFALAGMVGDDKHASLTLGRGNLANWQSTNLVMRSCAINTAAHELVHLISSDPRVFNAATQPIRDERAKSLSGTDAVASYLIGTVAQCTWLQKQGYSPAVDFAECVRVFGHRGFNGGRCNQFASGQEIRLRQDLFEEHVIND